MHLTQINDLAEIHPATYETFCGGNFTFRKKIALDQNHEMSNAEGVSVAIELLEKDAVLRRWFVSGPKVTRFLEEFESFYTLMRRVC